MLRKQTSILGVFLFLLDACVMAGCFLAAFYAKKYYVLADSELNLEPYLGLAAREAPFILAVLVLNGLYSSRKLLSGFGQQVKAIAIAAAQAFAVFIVISFYAKMFSSSRAIFTLFFMFLPVGLVASRVVLLTARRLAGRARGAAKGVLVFGHSALTDELVGRLASFPYSRFEILGIAGREGLSCEDGLERIEQGKADCVVIDLPFREIEMIERVTSEAEKEGVSIYMTPRVVPSTLLNLSWEMVGGVPLIALRPLDLPLAGKVAKRLMDVVLSFVGLVVLSPLMLLIAAAVRLTSRGSALFRQKRVGLDGKEFTMIKFRTMRADAEIETGPVWAKENDERCTGAGHFLRHWNLDELPQLLNVLGGSMSLVGPRPERPEFVKEFKGEIERYAHKHWVKPGITGWAQVKGWRGNSSLTERIRHDIYYMENWSLWLDFKILLMTPFCGYENAV